MMSFGDIVSWIIVGVSALCVWLLLICAVLMLVREIVSAIDERRVREAARRASEPVIYDVERAEMSNGSPWKAA